MCISLSLSIHPPPPFPPPISPLSTPPPPCWSIYLFICLYIILPPFARFFLPRYQSVSLFACLSVSVCLTFSLSISHTHSLCISVYLFVHFSDLTLSITSLTLIQSAFSMTLYRYNMNLLSYPYFIPWQASRLMICHSDPNGPGVLPLGIILLGNRNCLRAHYETSMPACLHHYVWKSNWLHK